MDFSFTQQGTILLGKAANEAAARSIAKGAVKKGGSLKMMAGLDVLVKEGLTINGIPWKDHPEVVRDQIKSKMKAHLELGLLR